jgi:hypothetical protein
MSGHSADGLGKNTDFVRRTESHFLQNTGLVTGHSRNGAPVTGRERTGGPAE